MSKELDNIDLTLSQRREITTLLNRCLPNTEVWAYGSRVNFTAEPSSDLDMVAFASKEQSQAIANLREAFEESSLPFRVDLFVWDDLPKKFHKNIEKAKVVVQIKEEKGFPEGWKKVCLNDVATVQSGFAFKSQDMGIDGAPVIKIKNLKPPNIDIQDVQRVPLSVICKNQGIQRFALSKGDILIAMTGATVGKIGRMPNTSEVYYLNQRVGKVSLNDSGDCDYDFLYYILSQEQCVRYIFEAANGSAQANISAAQIGRIEFNLPPLPEQKAIAHILGSLDDKIELNRRMNETLEAMAQALFKSWFVDFDPVIDNALAAGNVIPDKFKERAEIRQGLGDEQKSLPDDVRRLFPSEFEHTEEMGWIPKGWFIKQLDQIGIFRNGLALQKYPPVEDEENLPVVKIAQLREGNTNGGNLFASGVKEDFVINDGDFIFSWSGSLLAKFWVGGKGALNQHLFKVEGKKHPLWFVAGWVHRHMPEFRSIAENKATTMGHIKREHLSQANCVVPLQEVLKKLETYFITLIEKQILAEQGSRAISRLRDSLLPKFLSGEVRIEQAEQILKHSHNDMRR